MNRNGDKANLLPLSFCLHQSEVGVGAQLGPSEKLSGLPPHPQHSRANEIFYQEKGEAF